MDLNSKMAGMTETAYQNKANIGHNMGLREDTCAYRPRLTERVQKQAHQFAENAEHCARMRELAELLEKNPDVARILELMAEFRG